MKKKILTFFGIVAISWGMFFGINSTNIYAQIVSGTLDASCEKGLLGFRPWFQGLAVKDDTNRCAVGSPAGEDQMPAFVWTIVLNILADLMAAVGYLSLGFIVYGGYLYIMAGGDPGKIAKGKKTLMSAIIGIAIAVLSTVIVNTINFILRS